MIDHFSLQCQIIGEFLEANCPDVSVKMCIKDPTEWTEFISDLTRVYGFENVYSPIVYKIEGTLIGGAKEFQNHVKDCYDRLLKIAPETKKSRTILLGKQNSERMRRLHEGDTICEMIDH